MWHESLSVLPLIFATDHRSEGPLAGQTVLSLMAAAAVPTAHGISPMVANGAVLLPNVRRLFIPDPGHVILDCDLSGADAQVVAWEANDDDLKDAFKRGLKVHHKNAADMWGDRYTALVDGSHEKEQLYKQIKSGVHGTNYGGSARTLAVTLGWTVKFAEEFQRKWFALHPGIKTNFHGGVRDSLERFRGVRNRYGFRITYFDRIDSVFPEALAWIPQSTVALTCFRGALQVRERLPWVQLLLQVHDSLVMQIPRNRLRDILLVRDALLNQVPYPDPLTIPWDVSLSGRSWGEVKKVKWEEAVDLRL